MKYGTYDSVEADLEGANTGLNIVVRISIIVVGDQLAVDVAHGEHLGHLVEHDFGARAVGEDGLSSYNYKVNKNDYSFVIENVENYLLPLACCLYSASLCLVFH